MFSRIRSRGQGGDDDDSPPPQTPSSAPGDANTNTGPGLSPSPSRHQYPRRPVARSRESLRSPSVRIRRTPSSSSITSSNDGDRAASSSRDNVAATGAAGGSGLADIPEDSATGRRRSSSEPQRPSWFSQPNAGDRLARMSTVNEMSSIPEGQTAAGSSGAGGRDRSATLDNHLSPHMAGHSGIDAQDHLSPHLGGHGGLDPQPRSGVLRRMSNAARSWVPSMGGSQSDAASYRAREKQEEDEYDNEMVDLLDVIDPEVATLSTLTNVQNSLFVPNLGRFINRRPTYNLSRRQTATAEFADAHLQRVREEETPQDEKDAPLEPPPEMTEDGVVRPRLTHTSTISSTMSESRYAVLPHGETLAGWTPEEKAELNDMVRHMLHSRRAAFKRGMKGFGQYVKRPLGFFITLYATLVTLFGAAWVFFLIGWISLGSRKDYIVHVVDLVLVALFAIMGDGLAPFRAVDTYHMGFIAHFHLKSWRLRREMKLPKLQNRNDLPAKRNDNEDDIEYAAVDTREERREHRGAWEYSVLTPAEQKKLVHHQTIFARSHTFYKPHETETHYAFSLRLLIIIVVLLDLHSCFQIALGACTWGISYKTRPFWLTTFILCCSLACNITGGILISVGDKRTRKKEVIEKMFRQQVTHSAMKEVRKRRLKEHEEQEEQANKDPGSESDALPVHVPPPVLKRKQMEQQMAMKEQRMVNPDAVEQQRVAQVAEEKKDHKKNRWRSLPLLPYYVTKESRDFRHEEKQKNKAEKQAAIERAIEEGLSPAEAKAKWKAESKAESSSQPRKSMDVSRASTS